MDKQTIGVNAGTQGVLELNPPDTTVIGIAFCSPKDLAGMSKSFDLVFSLETDISQEEALIEHTFSQMKEMPQSEGLPLEDLIHVSQIS